MENGEFQKKVIGTLARLETKMDSVCKKQEDHEKRIRFLEKGYFIAVGILIVANIVIGFMK